MRRHGVGVEHAGVACQDEHEELHWVHLELFDLPHDEKECRVDDDAEHDERLEQLIVVVHGRQLVEKLSTLQIFAVLLDLLPTWHIRVYDNLILRS